MDWLKDSLAFLPISWREILDILLVSLLFHRLIVLVRGTRAVSVINGIIVVLVAYYLSGEFGLFTLHWLLTNFLSSFFLVLVILFQADIRKALSQVGLRWFGGGSTASKDVSAHELADALEELARRRVGALVVLERGILLGDIMARGVELSTKLSTDFLLTVFHHETPLHDGALIARGDQVAAVACILPLASYQSLPASFGTRHRAAVGVTEETDALALVVSEERGEIRAAQGGKLSDPLPPEELRSLLLSQWVGR
ncbi:MAG: TIGR00159 family protein [Desulfovibrio sp.]|nr:TIGR00159 family protein [Desulfovibrio sp.]MBI4960652.1 TIGR00159 family protein [Desulfovibrio sp.]